MRRDDGFTVIELVIAASILFTVLMGLFGLATASNALGTKGKQRVVASAAAGSYIESIRAVSNDATGYATVGTPSGNPNGTWTTTTVVRNGLTITITPTITWVDDPNLPTNHDYKKVSLAVQVSGGGTSNYTYTVSTYVRPGSAAITPTSTPTGEPTVAFTSDTPADGSALHGTVEIGAVGGHEASDGVLTIMRLIGGGYVVRSDYGDRAEWAVNAPTFTSTPNPFRWDTTASFEDTATGVVTPYYPDGPITLIAEVLDTLNHRSFVARTYTIDNSPPDVPPSDLVVTTPSNGPTPFTLKWTPSFDHGTIVPNHRVVAYRQDSTNASMTTWAATELVVPTPAGSPSSITSAYTGGAYFSRYAFTVQGCSARWPVSSDHNAMASSAAFSGPYVTRPFMSGTASGASSESHVLTVTAPSFPLASTPSYAWDRKMDAGEWTLLVTTVTNTYTYTAPDKNGVYQYRVRVTYTPSGPASVPTYAYSQICGQTNKSDTTFANVADWSQWW